MTANEIKGNLIIHGKTMKGIAAAAGVVPSAVTMIIQRKGKSRRLQKIIAQELRMDYDEVWAESA